MYMDEGLEFADAVSVGTPNSTTVNVGDIVDSDFVRDLGTGEPMYFMVQVTTAIISGGAATVRFGRPMTLEDSPTYDEAARRIENAMRALAK